jgi:hypothetical protein
MELDVTEVKDQMDREDWPRLKEMMEIKFKTKKPRRLDRAYGWE